MLQALVSILLHVYLGESPGRFNNLGTNQQYYQEIWHHSRKPISLLIPPWNVVISALNSFNMQWSNIQYSSALGGGFNEEVWCHLLHMDQGNSKNSCWVAAPPHCTGKSLRIHGWGLCSHRTMEWFGWEGTLKDHLAPTPVLCTVRCWHFMCKHCGPLEKKQPGKNQTARFSIVHQLQLKLQCRGALLTSAHNISTCFPTFPVEIYPTRFMACVLDHFTSPNVPSFTGLPSADKISSLGNAMPDAFFKFLLIFSLRNKALSQAYQPPDY